MRPIPPKRAGVGRASRNRVPVVALTLRAKRLDGRARRRLFRPTRRQKALGRSRTRCQTPRAAFFDFLLHRKVFDLIHVRLHVLNGNEWPFCENSALDQTHRVFSAHRIGAPPPAPPRRRRLCPICKRRSAASSLVLSFGPPLPAQKGFANCRPEEQPAPAPWEDDRRYQSFADGFSE